MAKAQEGDVVELQNGSVVQLMGWANGTWLVRVCDPATLQRDESRGPSPLDVPVKRVLLQAPRRTNSKHPGDYDPVKG